jgi:uncharacterized protein YndB with AHSA1/START domain/predicted enzyme related to lactoylglutathione lyase
MSLTVRVQPVVLARDWRGTLDWISRVFEVPVSQTSDRTQFGELLLTGERVGVLGRDLLNRGDATCALEVEVFDLEAALERATLHDAQTLTGPMTIEGGGRQASIRMPSGVVLWLWEADEGQSEGSALGNGPLFFSVRRRITAPIEQVFAALTQASELSKYFVREAKGDLKQGATVTWIWAGDAVALEVTRLVQDETVEFLWEAYGVDHLTRVRFDLVEDGTDTLVTVVESGWQNDARGRQSAFDHAEGWTEFLLHARLWIERKLDIR